MPVFVDKAKIFIQSGKGGDGHISFRREKFVNNGGPDGGDGGKGGDVIFKVDEGINTLADFHYGGKYKAENGQDGNKRRCHGKNGSDLIIKVPEGTVIKEAASGQVIADMSGDNKEAVILKGGRGGNGNMHYATSTMQAPKYAQPGQPAIELEVLLELKVIADVGLVGFPNVGKSTFLSKVSNAKPKIANYHFTTLSPMLGVVDLKDARGFVVADIPGLIEGASEGAGLGHEFLRHIERTRVMIHVVDAASTEGRDPFEDIEAINNELKTYNADITQKPQVIAANKIDMLPDGENSEVIQKIRDKYEPLGVKVFATSTLTGQGIQELLYYISKVLSEINEKPVIFEQEFFPETMAKQADEAFTVEYDEDEKEYVVEGPKIEKMLGYTNLESEKGFAFFQKFMADNGILDELEKLHIQEGDTVRMYGFSFEYYRNADTVPGNFEEDEEE
ncbi:GTP-binding protein Obg/CgtA [Butyrivibrio proteoclasticus B316]|uniref:GTPase Obg n=1 Tax=Butyrivibrio proteoclasticus (strain ATCC 51982 / DSM 14932 / B316) TaxID=515622 RepID=E0RUY6_BUTPB|nr:GTPase ObgE [Butyrivibrio proteoclasticus]ADL34177.1 GTP-binding protein Obg/CgtA [Butyrivibrio proteoclasticus B316]